MAQRRIFVRLTEEKIEQLVERARAAGLHPSEVAGTLIERALREPAAKQRASGGLRATEPAA